MDDLLQLGKHTFRSRLFIGTGKYKDVAETRAALEASGAEVITVALRRVNLKERGEGSLMGLLTDRTRSWTLLPNTAGCYTVDEAVRTCRLARELGLSELVKLEVIGDPKTLFPDNELTLEAAKILVKEGFTVLPYCIDDPIACRKLEDLGCAAVMPLAAPIGSGLGIRNPHNLAIILEQARVPVIVDAGVGTASDAAVAMELGCHGVLMNTAIALAQRPILMAEAMRDAIIAGRKAFLAGRMPRRLHASASSPLDGVVRLPVMLGRIATIAHNTYREAVRARILLGLAALALATALYSIAVGAFTLKDAPRVVSDLGAASISLYAIVVAVVVGGTSLYRELEQKTIYPILARPIHRWEYLVGKYLGTVLTLLVFIAFDAGAVLLIVATMAGRSPLIGVGVGLGAVGVLGVAAWKAPRWATTLPIPLGLLVAAVGAWLASGAPDEQRVVLGMSALALLEVGVVAALATLFASFSSPFLSAVFTLGTVIVGRSADTLAKLPESVFGSTVKAAGVLLSKVVPNLLVYAPPRPLLTGESTTGNLLAHLGGAAIQTVAWAVGLLALSSLIFRRRDFL
jgi:thiazole synthase